MAITLASDSLSDASVTDGIGRGDLAAAARLWVRLWPTALASARLYVDRPEVPGLAAEALIGTISMTALGRGPREDVAGFVAAAVRELGEDDEPPAIDVADLPAIFISPRLTRSFAALPASAQEELRNPDAADDHAVHALTVLQTSYLTTHLDEAPSRECKPTHIALLTAAEGRRTDGFAANNWLHMSTCAWCTEAFHELAFSNTALPALIAPAVFVTEVEVPLAPLEVEVAEPVLAAVAEEETEEVTPHRAGVHAVLRGGRNRILVAAAFTAAVALLAVVISQNLSGTDDGTAPSAVTSAQPSAEPTSTDGTDAHGFGGTLESPGALPTASVAGPLEIASPSATPEAETSATPKPKPTKKPSPTPSAPATSAPPSPDPTPTPSTSPTPACNPLQHLLGFC